MTTTAEAARARSTSAAGDRALAGRAAVELCATRARATTAVCLVSAAPGTIRHPRRTQVERWLLRPDGVYIGANVTSAGQRSLV